MKFFRHCYYAVRYGEWNCGWEMYENKPKFGFYSFWYDGQHVGFHLYKFWIDVYY